MVEAAFFYARLLANLLYTDILVTARIKQFLGSVEQALSGVMYLGHVQNNS